jgi:molecular chaperone GrpE
MSKSHTGHGHPEGGTPGNAPAEIPAPDSARTEPAAGGPSGAHRREDDPAGKLAAENADLKDRLLRALADAENVRRRAQKEVADAKAFGIAAFAKDILGVADNLGRALAALPAEERKAEGAVKTLIAGIELTDKDLLRILERHGIRKLVPLGEKFDPNFHEALFTVPDASVPPGTVSKVVEPGYAIGSRPLRPAKVGVAVAPA